MTNFTFRSFHSSLATSPLLFHFCHPLFYSFFLSVSVFSSNIRCRTADSKSWHGKHNFLSYAHLTQHYSSISCLWSLLSVSFHNFSSTFHLRFIHLTLSVFHSSPSSSESLHKFMSNNAIKVKDTNDVWIVCTVELTLSSSDLGSVVYLISSEKEEGSPNEIGDGVKV